MSSLSIRPVKITLTFKWIGLVKVSLIRLLKIYLLVRRFTTKPALFHWRNVIVNLSILQEFVCEKEMSRKGKRMSEILIINSRICNALKWGLSGSSDFSWIRCNPDRSSLKRTATLVITGQIAVLHVKDGHQHSTLEVSQQ